eukprot:TRINITY_DN2094_c0_g1_i3.p1 TRINITY_DN2094_c0_g1~~TRINITY_DN2094_c0_g1_i3.p1  ORF type:complete len:622 (-),score=155.77 TRINITY_DN2094_c0_g1_i3:43-1908(-)
MTEDNVQPETTSTATTPPQADSHQHHDEGEHNTHNGTMKWCSWCFDKTHHTITERHLLSKSRYKCDSCSSETVACSYCTKGMARSTKDGTDWLCAKCDKTIAEWGEKPNLKEKGDCSWCLESTDHLLIQYRYLKRNIYKCCDCKKRTVRCRLCGDAFARGHASADEEMCLVCAGVLTNWQEREKNKEKITRKAWCSWCVELSSHRLVEHALVERDVYSCSFCDQRTLPCNLCGTGFSCGGMGWDDQLCLSCSDHKIKQLSPLGSHPSAAPFWDSLHKLRDEVFTKQMTQDYINGELKRDSKERQQAVKDGMLRPFLLIVAMPPSIRLRVAASLGWCLITQQYFGDAHKEANDILHRSGQGLISRATLLSQRVHPIASSSVSYYQVLRRVIEAVFSKSPFPDYNFEQSQNFSNMPKESRILKMEEHIMVQMVEQQKESMTVDEIQEQKESMKSQPMQRLAKLMWERCDLHDAEAVQYAMSVVQSAVHTPSKWGLTLLGLTTLQASVPVTAAYVAPMVAGLGAILPPLAILGTVKLVYKGVNMAFGPSLDRLYYPIILLLNQRLLMAAENQSVDEFFDLEHAPDLVQANIDMPEVPCTLQTDEQLLKDKSIVPDDVAPASAAL